MSKLYKELKYDTDRVMQPGDPLTSFDGNTAIKAGNDTGKGFIETYGDVIDHYYDVTVDIPQVSGASARVRLKDVDETTPGVEILSFDGFPGASIDSSHPWEIQVNGSSWGTINCNPAWEDSTYPDYTIIPIGFGGRIYVSVSPSDADTEYCHWSDLEQTRQLISSKEISTTDQIPSLPLSVANGGTGVDGSSQAANKVLASPSSGTGAVSFRSLEAVDIPDLSTSKLTTGTLGVARGGTGKISHTVNSVIIGGISATGALQNVTSAKGAFYSTGSNKKPTFGTLPVAQGGTGMTTTTNVNAVVIGNSSDAANAMQTVAAASGAFYSTGANVKPQFGTLPVAQGGTGVDGSSQAINKVLASPASGSAGAISFRSLVPADIPNLNANKITSGTLAIARGGTGATTASAALTALGAAEAEHKHSFLYIGTTDTNASLTINTNGDAYVNKLTPGNGAAIKDPEARGSSRNTVVQLSGQVSDVFSQQPNKVLAGPSSGSTAGDISFRSLVEADIPTLSTSKISGLGDAATKNVGTTSGTVAAGDHTHSTLVSQDSKVTVTTTNDGTLTINKPGVPLTDNDTLASLATILGLPDTASLSDVQQALGLPDTATLADAMAAAATPINTRFATLDELPEVPIKVVKQNGTALTPDSDGAVNIEVSVDTGSYSLTTPEQTTSTTTTTNDTITVQLSDKAINAVQVPTTATNVVMKFPQQETGKARDFFVRLIVTGETVPSITLTEQDGSAIDFDVDDDSWTEIEQGVNLLMFTETAQ